MEKTCGKCRRSLPTSEFYVSSRNKDGLQHYCKECQKARNRADYARNPEKFNKRVADYGASNPEKLARNQFRRQAKLYGLDPNETEARFLAHSGLCDICGLPQDPKYKRKRLCIDHDDAAVGDRRFRGFLCNGCNAGIGGFKHDPAILEAAIRYLAACGVTA